MHNREASIPAIFNQQTSIKDVNFESDQGPVCLRSLFPYWPDEADFYKY